MRSRHLEKLNIIRVGLFQDVKSGNIIQLISDCTREKIPNRFVMKKEHHIYIEKLTINFCHDLHVERLK